MKRVKAARVGPGEEAAETPGCVISIRDLTKSYGRVKALDSVSLDVRREELFGLIGPDGAGKTTLYKILSTLLSADSGDATILGLDVRRDYRELRKRIGYMPERFSLYRDLTVSENLEFFATLSGVKVSDSLDLIDPIFAPQLSKFPDRLAGALSGGMKQKLALCCALIHRPEILLLDEPTTGVDAVSRSEFWDMLRSLKERGITIMVSTSYMDEAQLCDRIALINEGRIMRTDTPEALVDGIGERLYAVSADEMFKLLGVLRGIPTVENCYTFGATLHVVAGEGFDAEETARLLKTGGLHDVRIKPVKGDIEDLFIKLMRR